MYFSYQPDKFDSKGDPVMNDFDRLVSMMIEKAQDAFKAQQIDRNISHVIELMRYTDNVTDAIDTYKRIKNELEQSK